jgi:ABC-type transport system involved in multi-copper enzyme maturation permease subunit
MNTWNILGAMLKADFLERTRRYSFLIVLGLVIYLGYAVGAGQILILLDVHRGVYNSAWVGGLMAIVITFFLGLFGFYLVKNSIARDEESGVGQIIATTALSRSEYLLGKWLSNLAVLSVIVAILAAAALIIQLIRGEDSRLQLWPLLAPFLLIALPMMALVAALALLFETISWLKGGFGNVVYVLLFSFMFVAGVQTKSLWLDVTGFNLVASSTQAAAHAAFPTYEQGFKLTMADSQAQDTFLWSGVAWTPIVIVQRLLWPVVALGLVLLSSRFFQRFDPTRSVVRRAKQATLLPAEAALTPAAPTADSGAESIVRLTPLPTPRRFQLNIVRLVWLEAVLLVKGSAWYWLAGMAGIWIGCVAEPSAILRNLWFMLAALWPLLVWSQLGVREARYRTEALLGQVPYPLGRQLAVAWLAGVLLTAVALGGVVLGRIIWGEPLTLIPWALAVLFIPTLALALGTWSRSSKLFEIGYVVLWYLGPFNTGSQLVGLDYLGIHVEAPVHTAPLGVAGAIILLIALAAGRRQQMIRSW